MEQDQLNFVRKKEFVYTVNYRTGWVRTSSLEIRNCRSVAKYREEWRNLLKKAWSTKGYRANDDDDDFTQFSFHIRVCRHKDYQQFLFSLWKNLLIPIHSPCTLQSVVIIITNSFRPFPWTIILIPISSIRFCLIVQIFTYIYQ